MINYYKIKTNKAEYNLVEEDNNIYIGGDNFYCTEISYGILYYDKNEKYCYITKIDNWEASDMLNAIFYFYKYKYNGVCKFKLHDVSSNNALGDLSSYYLAFYQETMYERKFKAYIEDKSLNTIYINHKKIFNTKSISSKIFLQLLNNYQIESKYINILMELYNQSSSYKDFFNNLKKYYTKYQENSEKLIKPWLEEFIKHLLSFKMIEGQYWIIECKNITLDYLNYSIKEVSKNESLTKYKGYFMNIKEGIYFESHGKKFRK